MVQRRAELQELLEMTLGSEEVYFQPPANVSMQYPCIVYHLSFYENAYADNGPYKMDDKYTITHISRNPIDPVVGKIRGLPMTSFSSYFTADGLHHNVFTIYF